MSTKALTSKLIRTMEESPGDWGLGERRATHGPSGLGIWIRGGPFFLEIDCPHKVSLGWWQQLRLWWAVRKLTVSRAMLLVAGAEAKAKASASQGERQLSASNPEAVEG